MLKKAASGVLAILPCSRTMSTLRASKWLRPCWTDFFEHSLQLMMAVSSWACIFHGSEIFNSPNMYLCAENMKRITIVFTLGRRRKERGVFLPVSGLPIFKAGHQFIDAQEKILK